MTPLRRPCDCALPNTLRGFDRCSRLIAFTFAVAESIFTGLEWQRMVGADRAQGVLDNVWSASESVIALEVDPFVWQTRWFRASVLGGCLIAGLALYRFRMRQMTSRLNVRFEERLSERTRIAQELHDTLLQGFLSASMQVHVATDLLPDDSASRPLLTRSLQLMQQVIDEGRNTLRGLRTSTNVSIPLETALSQIKEEIAGDNAVNFRIVVEGRRRDLHPILRDEVYRIGREALLNAFRRAHARNIEVEMNYARDEFRLFVRDDGSGIADKMLQTGRDGHWGLVGMRERAERIGAQLHVLSRRSAGTEVRLALPTDV